MNSGKRIMVVFCSAALLVSVTSFSQKIDTLRRRSNGYAAITFLAGFGKSNSFGGAMNFGVKTSKKSYVGLGFEIVKFKALTSFYVPAYADFKYRLSSKSIETYLIVQPGYGFFRYKDDQIDSVAGTNTAITSTIEQQGGFYFSTGIGVKLKRGLSPYITLRYGFYGLKTKTENGVFANKNISNISSVVLNAGIAF